MICADRLIQGALMLALGIALSGCLPEGRGQLDEEKEPHFLAGKSRVNSLDYRGAIESFEKALEVNPRSASAHLELGILYDQKEADPAAAIYHYGHYLKFRPDAPNAEMLKQRIMACKQELARTVSLGPFTDRQQKDLEKMAEENKRLTEDVRLLKEEVTKWSLAYSNRPAGQSPGAGSGVVARGQGNGGASAGATAGGTTTNRPSTAPSGRTHTVKSGETPASIARQYGVKLDSLMSANSGLDARRMRVGQTLNIPPR